MNILCCIFLIGIPLTAKHFNYLSVWLIYAEIFVIMGFNAVLQASVYGLAGILQPKYTIAVSLGNGLIGTLICLTRLFCLGVIEDSWNGTMAYFGVVIFIMVCGIVGFIFIPKREKIRAILH